MCVQQRVPSRHIPERFDFMFGIVDAEEAEAADIPKKGPVVPAKKATKGGATKVSEVWDAGSGSQVRNAGADGGRDGRVQRESHGRP